MITVSPAAPGDAPAIAGLLEELGEFYGTPAAGPLDQRVAQVGQALFAGPAGYALLAREEPALAGLAAYSFLWPAIGPTRSLYLKELYVARPPTGAGASGGCSCGRCSRPPPGTGAAGSSGPPTSATPGPRRSTPGWPCQVHVQGLLPGRDRRRRLAGHLDCSSAGPLSGAVYRKRSARAVVAPAGRPQNRPPRRPLRVTFRSRGCGDRHPEVRAVRRGVHAAA